MKNSPSPVTKSSLVRWLCRGSLFVGLLLFASCSSNGAQPSPSGPSSAGTCQAPTQECNGACANFDTDPTNCGSCGNACIVGQSCVGGACKLSCVAPQVECGTQCADTASNALNCGACGQACATGEICQNSACVTGSCPDGQSLCSGACVDTNTDATNCGACGFACLVGQSCSAGSCSALTCNANEAVCNGVCTDITAAGNCGGCGLTCAAGQTCQAGSCVSDSGLGGSGGTSSASTTTDGTTTTDTGTTTTTTTSTSGGGTGGSGGSTTTGSGGSGGSTTTGSGGSGGSTSGECRVWLATNGNDSNDGSESSPVKTLAKAYDLMCPKPPDGTDNGAECLGPAPRSICVKPGTYPMTERLEFKKTRMGTADNRLILEGDPSSSERPVFDFSGQERLDCGDNPDNTGGFTMNANYVTIKNVEIQNANDNCILVQGSEGLVEHVLVHDCADTGIQISSGGEYEGSGTNNTILNCDSHSNYDPQCNGENADGFSIKEGGGDGNAFIGCRSWDNTDDGWDLFAWTSPVRIENCWAFDQCATTQDSGSDCNGFKLGGDSVSTTHQLQDMIAVGNSRSNGHGFTDNSNPAPMTCNGTCAAWGNLVDDDSIGGVSTTPIGNANVTNMASDNARNADGSLKSISSL